MTEYALYLESGPRQRKTMVHVLDLLGCIAQGPTTAEALAVTPEAIRAYLGFLARHGDDVDPRAPVSTVVAAHVMEGPWLGNGDPTPGFAPDFLPLDRIQLEIYLDRLGWLGEDLAGLARSVTPEDLRVEPDHGWSLQRILEHVAGAHCVYLRYAVGKVDGLSDALKAVEHEPGGVADPLANLWRIAGDCWAALTDEERTRIVPHGQVSWTARRGLRRALEHGWEHLLQVSQQIEAST